MSPPNPPPPKKKVKVKIAIIILTGLSEWYGRPITRVVFVVPNQEPDPSPTLVTLEEGVNLTADQIRALQAFILKHGVVSGIGTLTVELAEESELTGILVSDLQEIEFEAGSAHLSEEAPVTWCESTCEDEDKTTLDGLAVLAE